MCKVLKLSINYPLFLSLLEDMQKEIKKEGTVKLTPAFRFLENGHILLWLIKDTCWAMTWRPGGIFMIAPTLGVAFYILWKSRHHRAELFHNIAIFLWISANSVWMTGEFFKIELKPYVVSIFFTGLTVLAIYYLFFFAKDRREEKAKSIEIP